MINLYKIRRFYVFYGSINTLLTFIYKIKQPKEDALTIIITSSGRIKYLEKTLFSLKNYLVYDRKIYWHIIDDNPSSRETRSFIKSQNFDVEIFNKKNKGLGYSLNKIYRTVRTKYILHCEDDWEFLREINVKTFLSDLGDKEQLILNRSQPYKFHPHIFNKEAYLTRYYSFNPHFVKFRTVIELLPFSQKNTERTISDKARSKNILSRISGYGKNTYVTHIGEKQTVKKY